jgi:ankyrin repeat protein
MKFIRIAIASAALAAVAVPVHAQLANAGLDFVQAIRSRDGDKAMQVLQQHPNVIDATDDKGNSGLIISIMRSDEDYVSFLLNKGADPNLPGADGDTPLIVASRIGFSQAVQWLLGLGAKVDEPNDMGETALIAAVQQRQAPIVRILLAAGANPDKTDAAQGFSARQYAERDNRGREILRMIEAKKPKPAAAAATSR